jgi:hypothetical protein
MRDLFDRNAMAERLGEEAAVSRRWKKGTLPDFQGSAGRMRSGAPPNHTARRAGHQDGLEGHRDHAGRWPSGTYGHGDYELGHCAGDDERRLMEEIKDGQRS